MGILLFLFIISKIHLKILSNILKKRKKLAINFEKKLRKLELSIRKKENLAVYIILLVNGIDC